MKFTFGPVPSRRLGRSLGVNNIPPKVCTYACVYCQLGRTSQLQIEIESFYPPEAILADVEARVEAADDAGEPIDYLTLVPDGEPTLDANLGVLIPQLRTLELPVAVITNASLLWKPDMRAALQNANWVSVKVDAGREETWHRIDRPHGALDFDRIQAGIRAFAAEFQGTLVTETMLVRGYNDTPAEIAAITQRLISLSPTTSYLAVPTRPPAEPDVHPPRETSLHAAYRQFEDAGLPVHYLIAYEGIDFSGTGEIAKDILSITAVHPMRADALHAFVHKAGADWSTVEALIAQGTLLKLTYGGHQYYVRKLPGVRRTS